MNFLLHAWLARRDLVDATAAVGAMLPDLWRMAHRRAHVRSLPPNAGGAALQAGLVHHSRLDAWFHDDEALHRGEHALRLAMAGLSARKLGLLAHPLWEMCLDGAWLRVQGLAREQHALDELLDAARPARAEAEAALAAVLGPDGEVFFRQMARIEGELRRGPWLAAYTHGEGLAWCLDGVRLRTGLPRLDPAERTQLGEHLDALAPLADTTLAAIQQDAPRLPLASAPRSSPRDT